jgi:DNA-directed RNA polymerases I, II, and III subunit RPABC2
MADENEYIDDIDDEELIEEDEGQKSEEAGDKEGKAFQFLNTHHPECRLDYKEDILLRLPLESYPPDHDKDKKHKSVPYLTIFEKTKILGFRANQLAQGSRPFLTQIPPHVTDVLEIAAIELEQKRLPFILKRPMPDGSFEYVKLSDLMIL